MQTKFSYRVLKWTLLVGTAASMATACVVTTSGDGGGDGGDISFAGETSTSGKTSTGGSTSTAGKTSTGGSSSTAGTSATTAGTSAGGQGGAGSGYVPGLCEVDSPTPTMVPSCDPDPVRDKDQPCKICLKAKACEAWQTCYGDTPTTACGWGVTEDAPGQFDCIQDCWTNTPNASDDVQGTLQDCEGKCLNQCANKDDGFALTDTQALLGEAQDKCLAECFP
jgi:hypothetical protein